MKIDFDQWNRAIRNSEASLVNLLSAIAPWGAPLAPAVMSFNGMTAHLGFNGLVAGIIAFVIEILGLATVHTTITFWQYNRKRIAEAKRRPTGLAAGMFGMYLLIVLATNVLLELPQAFEDINATFASWIPIICRALLSLLAVPAAVTLAIRAMHMDLLAEKPAGKKEENSGKKSESSGKAENTKSFRQSFRDLPEEDRALIANMKTADIAQRYNISERTARNWKGYAQAE